MTTKRLLALIEAREKSWHRYMLNPDSAVLFADYQENRRGVERAVEELGRCAVTGALEGAGLPVFVVE